MDDAEKNGRYGAKVFSAGVTTSGPYMKDAQNMANGSTNGTGAPKGGAPALRTPAPSQQGSRPSRPPRGLELATERWDFFKDQAKQLLQNQKGLIAIIILLIIGYYPFYLVVHIDPSVIGINSRGQTVRIPLITEPGVSAATIQRFCVESVAEIGTFGFNDFNMRFNALQPRFTDTGWRQYNATTEDAKIRDSVRLLNQTYATTTNGACVIVDHKLKDGHYWWLVRVDAVRQVWSGKTPAAPRNLHVEMEIIRVGITESNELVAIERYAE